MGRSNAGSGIEPQEETGWDVARDGCLQTSVGQLHARERDRKVRLPQGEVIKGEVLLSVL